MRIGSLILTILIAIQIFWFSSISMKGAAGTNFVAVAYHFIIFFLFSFFLFFTIKGKNKIKSSHIFTTIILSIIYAISDEVHQLFVPLRSASITDIFTDTAGILISTFFYIYISKKSKTISCQSNQETFRHSLFEESNEHEHD